MEQHFENSQVDYANFLDVRFADVERTDRTHAWCFAVSENFTIFVTSRSHAHLFVAFGVDPDEILAKGYVFFDSDGRVRAVDFQHLDRIDVLHAGDPVKLINFENAVSKKIKDALEP